MLELREPVKVIGDVLQAELGLDVGQIMLTNQKWNIPQSAGLYIAISYVSGKAIANKNDAVSIDGGGMTEQQSVVMHYLIQIDAMSFDNSARIRKEEIIMALRSIAAQVAMEVNNLQIARVPGEFYDASSLEETARLNRFTMTIAVTALRTKEKAVVDYYSEFQIAEVTVNE